MGFLKLIIKNYKLIITWLTNYNIKFQIKNFK